MAMNRTLTSRATEGRPSSSARPRRGASLQAESAMRFEGRPRVELRARRRRIGSVLVAAQFGLVGVCLAPWGPTLGWGPWPVVGAACAAGGLVVGGLALLAMGADTRIHPVPGQDIRLRRNGIYSVIRHPMYAAVLLVCVGVALMSARVLSVLAVLALSGVLSIKARFEDKLLGERFGWEFAVYASRVPAVIPQPWRSHRR